MKVATSEAVKNQNKTNCVVIIDLTSFLKYNIAKLFRYLKARYPEANFIAYINNSKPEFSGWKKLRIYEICSEYEVKLLSTVKAPKYMLRTAERESRKPSPLKRKVVLVSNSKFMIEKYVELFRPEEVEFVMLSSTYYELPIQKLFQEKTYSVVRVKLLPVKLDYLSSLLSLSRKEISRARGFHLKEKLNQKLLDMLPAPVWKLQEEIEKHEKYRDRSHIALAGFILHNSVVINPKDLTVYRVSKTTSPSNYQIHFSQQIDSETGTEKTSKYVESIESAA